MEIRVQEHSAHVVIVTIDNQPRRNAMTRQMMAELAAVWDRLEHSMELLLTATLIDTTAAAQIGLVNRVIPSEGLMPWALETAATIAANSPTAVQAVKQQISTTLAEQALAREALDQALGDRVRASPHFTEGVTAFRHKRQPNYP